MQNLSVAIKSIIISFIAVAIFVMTPNSASAIVGGEEAQAEWVVAVALADEADGYYAQFCGGTLIDAEWVLTAAHCIFDANGDLFSAEALDVIVGRTDLTSNDGERIAVVEIIGHEDFNFETYTADVALLHLSRPANAPVVRLAENINDVTSATVLGWGITDVGYTSEVLRSVDVPIVSNSACRKAYAKLGYPITETMTCAGYENGTMDSCTGDSGGPLVNIDDEGTVTQVGIVSWGIGCGHASTYGVYTDITTVSEWVQAQINSVN